VRIRIEHLDEPELLFENGRRGIEPRRALNGHRIDDSSV
jgi:hypothetical protein